eukprot:CAMPEP_0197264280 /NCGR_PEP_ID=MMETSP1432-20130617/1703_1 /TAXON_ID=44447 /ORGANISM="Pseudo-nitzschia delicatissima, Strain UNC1205" /LENGTH=53 /DNA_ID=CAMNT_0042728911 /DNA_START=360 /DNA_END=524 /DNA_ORIENTATION=+
MMLLQAQVTSFMAITLALIAKLNAMQNKAVGPTCEDKNGLVGAGGEIMTRLET